MRALALCCAAFVAAQTFQLQAQGSHPRPLELLDVPYISQSELLCGGAAAAMVLRYWGERGVSAESFASLVDRSAAGIRTDVLTADLRRRGWMTAVSSGSSDAILAELARGRPVLTLIEDRPSVYHYIVIVGAHARGVVFHDPARAPFLVMSSAEFDRRWRAANRWMAAVVPGPKRRADLGTPEAGSPVTTPPVPISTCDQLVAEGVRFAQAGDLVAAERALSSAIACPAAMRELAGVRVLQKRWTEAADLAAAAVDADEHDTYAWKVLATSRFVQDDRLGALAAWNHVGEPRLDLIQFDGLTRTRHRAVERLVHMQVGEVLSPDDFMRARRRLAELPAASSTRLEYVPVGGGLAELRGAVSERPLVPTGRLALAGLGLAAAVTRELRATTGSFMGEGEQIELAWRFWPRRPRVLLGVKAPAPWGGLWGVNVYGERQSFSSPAVVRAERVGGRVDATDWLAGRWRWSLSAGVDEWSGGGARGAVGSAIQFASIDGRVDARVAADGWPGRGNFATTRARLRARSSAEPRNVVLIAAGGIEAASARTPLDLWRAGDTGHARSAFLRAHPVLDGGRLRVDRLGRTLVHGSVEAQRWWRVAGPVRAAAAMFADVAYTGRRLTRDGRRDADLGVGVRVAITGIPGVFHASVAQGLSDGATAISFTFEP